MRVAHFFALSDFYYVMLVIPLVFSIATVCLVLCSRTGNFSISITSFCSASTVSFFPVSRNELDRWCLNLCLNWTFYSVSCWLFDLELPSWSIRWIIGSSYLALTYSQTTNKDPNFFANSLVSVFQIHQLYVSIKLNHQI